MPRGQLIRVPSASRALVCPSGGTLHSVASSGRAPLLHERMRRGALEEVRGRTWETALERLAAGYVLASASTSRSRREASRRHHPDHPA